MLGVTAEVGVGHVPLCPPPAEFAPGLKYYFSYFGAPTNDFRVIEPGMNAHYKNTSFPYPVMWVYFDRKS